MRRGFCWNNVLNPNARLLKVKLKQKSINDVGSMSLTSVIDNIPNFYFITLLNSNLLFDYYREFINCTVNIQINDIRQLPIIIPNNKQIEKFKKLFDKIYYITKNESDLETKKADILALEKLLDLYVNDLYSI